MSNSMQIYKTLSDSFWLKGVTVCMSHFCCPVYSSSVDTTPPDIMMCPSDIEVIVELGTERIAVAWVEPSSADASQTDRLLSRSNEPNSLFPVGDTTVTYVFADMSGNTAFCTFLVTVTPGE